MEEKFCIILAVYPVVSSYNLRRHLIVFISFGCAWIELVFKALRKTCGKLFTGSCKSKAVDRAIEKDPKCAAILFNGPGAGNPDCADFDAAIDIFTDLLETCQSTPNDLPEALRDSSDGPRRNPGEFVVPAAIGYMMQHPA